MSIGTSLLKPNDCAAFTMISGPRVTPISAKAVLQDRAKTWGKVPPHTSPP